MSLEESNVLDIAARPQPGKIHLVIVDTGSTLDPQDRYEKLLKKLSTYVMYATSDRFKKDHPGLTLADVTIVVECLIPPTRQMYAIEQVFPRGDRSTSINVIFKNAQVNRQQETQPDTVHAVFNGEELVQLVGDSFVFPDVDEE